ncbi:MAG: NAD(P)-dependent oxidoreductase [Clostridiales bacterium]|nr:NAD(P)-dependent oxidoreductase [Clostridiales bacterium]
MKVVVTGAGSFIGAATVWELLMQGHEVEAIVRPHSPSLGHLIEMIPDCGMPQLVIRQLDLADIRCLEEEPGMRADVWLQIAWDGAGSANRTKGELQHGNVQRSLQAVQTAAAIGCRRFLFTGSQAEYGICHERICEDREPNPVSEYGKAKAEFGRQAEPLCRSLGLEYVHARIFSVYGPGDHPWTLVNSCLRTFREGGVMELGPCTQFWNFLYIDDAARALSALLTEGRPGVYNIAGEDTRPLKSFVEEMYRFCGSKGSYVYGIRPQNAEGAADLMPDIEKLCRETGWRPKWSFAEGLAETLYCLPRDPA